MQQIGMTLVLVLQIIAALVMIGLVLIQHGKGADAGASFGGGGGGSSGSLFGASGSANFLSRSTAACATIFFVCTLALAMMANTNSRGGAAGGSVLDRPAAAASAPAGAALPATGVIPGAAIPAPVAPAAPAPAASR